MILDFTIAIYPQNIIGIEQTIISQLKLFCITIYKEKIIYTNTKNNRLIGFLEKYDIYSS